MGAKRIIPGLTIGRDGALIEPFGPPTVERPHDPLAAARAYGEAGAEEIMLVARDASDGALVRLVERIASSLDVPLAVWADLDGVEQVGGLLTAGAASVTIQRAALADPNLVAALSRGFGADAIWVAVTAVGAREGWRVLDGPGGAATEWDAVTWARVVEAQNGGTIIVESPGGGREGGPYDLELLAEVTAAVARPVIAAGAAAGIEDMFDALMIGGADGVLVSSLFESGELTIGEAQAFLAEHGLS